MPNLRERTEPALRIVCYILAAVVAYELVTMIVRWNPFRGAVVPELPTLTASTNTPPGGAHGTNLLATASGKGTNSASSAATNTASTATAKTNAVLTAITDNKAKGGTNLNVHIETPVSGTNVAAVSITNVATNVVISLPTNSAAGLSTNAVATSSTNAVAVSTTNTIVSSSTNAVSVSTNGIVSASTNAMTNSVASLPAKAGGTNSAASMISTNFGTNGLLSAAAGTNAASDAKSKKKKPGASSMPDMAGMPGMEGSPFQPPGKRAELPPAVQARVSRITESEILGPVMHPLPMALLGIAGDIAFIRSDSGQTGLVKPGDSLDNIKVIKVGINRVLIEQDGQKKELTIFSGYGSDTLLQNDSTNENKHP